MLSFLNPWLWFGLIAVGAPLWLHLSRRDREKIIYFGALRFLEDQPIVQKPPLFLRNLFLLLLRLLAIILLVLAFTQPYFYSVQDAITSSHVFILDNTLSRQIDHGFERDRDEIVREIQQSGTRHQIAVVEMRNQSRILVSFGDDPQQALARLSALKPSNERGTMLSAVTLGNQLLKQSLGAHKQLTILSDHQTNQWNENANTPPFLSPGTVTLSPFSNLAERPNFYVTEPRLQRLFLGDVALIQFSALLGHTGPEHAATVTLTANGNEIFHQTVQLDPKTDKLTLTAKWPCDPSIWLKGQITVTADKDDLALDNTAYFSLPPVAEGRVALLTQSTYLKAALSGPVVKGHWQVELVPPAQLEATLKVPFGNEADVLMIDANYLQSSQARALADRYFQNGRGVFIMIDQISTLFTGYLQKLGFEPKSRFVNSEDSPLEPIRFFSLESPIFAPFLMADFPNLLEVRVGDTVPLNLVKGTTLLYSKNGEGLLFSGTRFNGRLLLTTFSFDRKQTDWVIHPSFVPFIDLALQYLRPTNNNVTILEPGESWLVRVPPHQNIKTVTLHDEKQAIQTVNLDGYEHATLTAPEAPGLYGLSYDQAPELKQMLVINPSSLESDLHYLQKSPDILTAWTQSIPAKPETEIHTEMRGNFSDAAQQKYWWVCLLASGFFLVMEMLILAKGGSSP